MLEVRCEEYLKTVWEFARETGRDSNLQEKLDYLAQYACQDDPTNTRCVLGKDFAPYSFSFQMEKKREDGEYRHWFSGGLVFHGSHDNGGNGGAPTFSVSIDPTDGWSVHT